MEAKKTIPEDLGINSQSIVEEEVNASYSGQVLGNASEVIQSTPEAVVFDERTMSSYSSPMIDAGTVKTRKSEKFLSKSVEQQSVIPEFIITEFSELINQLQPDEDMTDHVNVIIDHVDNNMQPKDYRKRPSMTCKYCSVVIKSRHHFRRHIITHPEVIFKPWKCPLCDYRALIKSTVKKHINIHSEVKPYSCSICDRGFNFRQKLQQHMKYHEDVREFYCPSCAMSFHEIKTLKNHVKNIHQVYNVTAYLKTQDYRTPKKIHLKAAEMKNSNTKTMVDTDTGVVLSADKIYPKTSKLAKINPESHSFDSPTNVDTDTSLPHINFPCSSIEVIHDQLEIASSQEINSSQEMTENCSEEIIHNSEQEILDNSSENIFESTTQAVLNVSVPSQDSKSCDTPMNDDEEETCAPMVDGVVINVKDQQSNEVELPCDSINTKVNIDQINMLENLQTINDGSIPPRGQLVTQNLTGQKVFQSNENCNIQTSTSQKPKIIYIKLPPNVKIVQLGKVQNPLKKMQKLKSIQIQKDITMPNEQEKSSVINGHDSDVTGSETMKESSACEIADKENSLHTSMSYLYDEENSKTIQTSMQDLSNGGDDNENEAALDSDREVTTDVSNNQFSKNEVSILKSLKMVHKVANGRSKSSDEIEEGVKKYIIFEQNMDEETTSYDSMKCALCYEQSSKDVVFSGYSKFLQHLFTEHPTVKPFQCDVCGLTYRTKPNLISHKKMHSDVKSYVCFCGKSFRFSQKLKAHKRVHENLRDFKCTVCDKAFNEKSDLNRHIKKVHKKEKYVSCKECRKSFYSLADMRRHQESHLEEKNYQCKYCDKMYQTRVSLAQHIKSHTCMFHCEICNRDFGSYSGFMAHKVMHDESSDGFRCPTCDKLLLTKGSLKRHQQICHSESRPFTCNVCDQTYKSKKDLQSHSVSHATDKCYYCDTCQFNTKRYETLRVHMRRHSMIKPFRCGMCPKQYTQRIALRNHMIHHTEESYNCEICDLKLFSKNERIQHMMKCHLPEELKEEVARSGCMTVYMCEYCQSMFLSQDSLSQHVMTDHLSQGLVTPTKHSAKSITSAATTFTVGVDEIDSSVVSEVVSEISQQDSVSSNNTKTSENLSSSKSQNKDAGGENLVIDMNSEEEVKVETAAVEVNFMDNGYGEVVINEQQLELVHNWQSQVSENVVITNENTNSTTCVV